ncbi:hypothetical protein BRADI_3g44280v3 [Brachypodium distachyon]|uniref:F-box domain-containing protein n=2 Tax=Brachypodium distachyon TaxID=15368 RepID=A0A0Q3FIZ8_BRADI|nr:hypothetical protein BRADI_3g44280v3 [Brachypodium distachyon]
MPPLRSSYRSPPPSLEARVRFPLFCSMEMAAGLPVTEDLVVDILSRLPIKSLCRSKGVSRAWRDLISHPDNRSKFPHTLVGFFHSSFCCERFPVSALHFINISGKGRPVISPSFAFLPKHESIVLLDCCNGLLLCHLQAQGAARYVVCNPTTKKWAMLPDSGLAVADKMSVARLGFDPAVSSHFHVFEFLEEGSEDMVVALEVYSSETGGWVHKQIGWADAISFLDPESATVFLNGSLHFVSLVPAIAVVDTEGETWRIIPVCDIEDDRLLPDLGFVQQSQGCLHYANFERHGARFRLVVYVLEAYGSQEWKLKHSAEASSIFQGRTSVDLMWSFKWMSIHPECNLIFFIAGWDNTLMSYDMDRQQVHVIRILGHDVESQYLPYIPLYSELPELHI